MITPEERYFPLKRAFPCRAVLWKQNITYRKALSHRFDHWVWLTDYVLRAPSPQAVGKRIAFLSDLHWENDEKSKRILESAEKAIRKAAPDYLILGGDIAGNADRLESLHDILPRLRSLAEVVIAINGNWETGKDWLPDGYWHDLYRKYDIIHLRNQVWHDENFSFVGTDDICRGDIFLPPLPERANTGAILLAHSPDTVIALDSDGALSPYFLALCGHNHGGQIRIPLTKLTLPLHSRYGGRFCCGLFRRRESRMKMIVGTGLNEGSFPVRWNCRRELNIIHFRKPRSGYLMPDRGV